MDLEIGVDDRRERTRGSMPDWFSLDDSPPTSPAPPFGDFERGRVPPDTEDR